MIIFPLPQNSIPSLNETVQLKLNFVSGGARLGNFTELSFDVLEHDYPYGLYHWNTDQFDSYVREGTQFTINILRSFGTVDSATLFWSIIDINSTDIAPTSGYVFFQDGQMNQSITIDIIDDILPEIDEHLTVSLTLVSGLGALDQEASGLSFIIEANDNILGIFDFLAEDQPPQYFVHENDSVIMLPVTRLFGNIGNVSLDYTVRKINANDSVLLTRGEERHIQTQSYS
jgi:hypothetical protein